MEKDDDGIPFGQMAGDPAFVCQTFIRMAGRSCTETPMPDIHRQTVFLMSEERMPRVAVRGRPSKEDAALLRQRILACALSEFREHGYAGSGIEGIARAAGVSRTTIYALYSNKPTLFGEMIRSAITIPDLSKWVSFDDRPPEIVLREALVALNRAYHREPNLEIIRLCIAESERFPDLFEQVRTSLGMTLDGLAAYLGRLRESGKMAIPDTDCAAKLFNMLAIGSLKPFFVSQHRLSSQDRDGHLDMALNFFLYGCLAPRPARQTPEGEDDT